MFVAVQIEKWFIRQNWLRWNSKNTERSGIRLLRIAERNGRGFIEFIWSVLAIWLVSFNQTNQTDQINKKDRLVLAFHAPRSVVLADFFSILVRDG